MRTLIVGSVAAALLVTGCSKKESERQGQASETAASASKAATGSATGEAPASPPARSGSRAAPTSMGTKAAPDGRRDLGAITVVVPDEWKETPPSSRMRKAQWQIPVGDKTAELVTYYFGPGGAGGIEANVNRWVGQFKTDDGSPAQGKVGKGKVAGLDVHTVAVSGHYVAAMRPGAASGKDKANYKLDAAIVETKAGPYYFKLVGPAAVVDATHEAFTAFIHSIQPR
jgi:hypothetical protein